MQTTSSAKRTCKASRSASECTATVLMPSSRQAQMTRQAISPRLAIRTFLNIRWWGVGNREWGAGRIQLSAPHSPFPIPHSRLDLDSEQWLAVFDRLAVFDEGLGDGSAGVGRNLVHQLHRLDDAERLSGLDRVAEFNEGFSRRRRGAIESADDRRGDDVQFLFRRNGGRSGMGRGRRRRDKLDRPVFAGGLRNAQGL